MLCYDDRMMAIFKKYCVFDTRDTGTLGTPLRPLIIDTTFNMGNCWVSPVVTQHPELREVAGSAREPSVLVAFLLHKKKSQAEFKWLADTLREKAGLTDYHRVVGRITDDDKGLLGLDQCS